MSRFHTPFHKMSCLGACLLLVLTCGLIYAQEETETPAEEPAVTEEVTPAPEPPAKPAEVKSAETKPAEVTKPAEPTEVSRVTDIHLQAVGTLDIPEADKKKAQELSEEYVAVFARNARRTAENRFWTEEAARLHKLYDKNGAFRDFIAEMIVIE